MRIIFICLLIFFLWIHSSAQHNNLQALLDSLRIAGNFPGLSMAIASKDGSLTMYTSGYNNRDHKTPLHISNRFLQGSVGKTYASAIALRLVEQGRIHLDKKVAEYLGQNDWFHRVPNAGNITVRMLMNHTSGVMRYEFKEQFLKDLTADPGRVWQPRDLIKYILDEKASFEAGGGWEYSDTNYILLGMIIEHVTGKKYYAILKQEILEPNQLKNTFPQDARRLQNLAQGYAGSANEFGGKDEMMDSSGLLIINPQFEWTGGGVYSTTGDLARWGKLLYAGKIVDTNLLYSSAVAAKLGKDTKYALGVIIRSSPFGITYGHSGFFPGYLTELLYFPAQGICIALQANTSDFKNLKLSLLKCALVVVQASQPVDD